MCLAKTDSYITPWSPSNYKNVACMTGLKSSEHLCEGPVVAAMSKELLGEEAGPLTLSALEGPKQDSHGDKEDTDLAPTKQSRWSELPG